VLGKKRSSPEKNTILRCFQYISPETIPTDVSAGIRIASIAADRQTDGRRPAHELLSCKFLVSAGMENYGNQPRTQILASKKSWIKRREEATGISLLNDS